jgi:dihydrofolate synthase/folylpolyglutamate synthase
MTSIAPVPRLIEQFEVVEAARGDTSLTWFEFTTLAILRLFERSSLDVVVLEVGLGGRLDAVNIIDADCAIVTCIDMGNFYMGQRKVLDYKLLNDTAQAKKFKISIVQGSHNNGGK